MTDSVIHREVVLANGDRVPLDAAAAGLALLGGYLHSHEAEWDPLPLVRSLALGHDLPPEQLRCLQNERLVDAAGHLDPVLRSVVLAAVRGEGAVLRLDSPFTDPTDRALAELRNAQEYLRVYLPPDQAAALLGPDRLLDRLRWTDRTGRDPEPPARR